MFCKLYPQWFRENKEEGKKTLTAFSDEINRIIDPHNLYNRLSFVQAAPDALRVLEKDFTPLNHATQFGVSTIVSQGLCETNSIPVRKIKVAGKWSEEYRSLHKPRKLSEDKRPKTSPTAGYYSDYYHSAIKKIETRYKHEIGRGIPSERVNMLK